MSRTENRKIADCRECGRTFNCFVNDGSCPSCGTIDESWTDRLSIISQPSD